MTRSTSETADRTGAAAYAPTQNTTEGTVHMVTGGDWDKLLEDDADSGRIVINFGLSFSPPVSGPRSPMRAP